MRCKNYKRGSVLLIVIVMCFLLAEIGLSLTIATVAENNAGADAIKRAIAISVAESGVERVKIMMDNHDFDYQFASQNNQATFAEDIYTPGGELYGRYAVRVVNEYAGVANQYLVVSQGTISSSTREVQVVLQKLPAELPDTLGAINLYNPNGLANFCGLPPNISGLDTNLPEGIDFSSVKASDCVPGSGDGPDAVGIAVHDDESVDDIIDELGRRTANVVGTDGAGGSEEASVYNVTAENPTGQIDDLTADDIVEIADNYAKMADYVYDGSHWRDGDGGLSTPTDLGTTANPKVILLSAPAGETVTMTGDVTGVGVLIIDCEVRFRGTFNYAGLILITRRGDAIVSVDMAGTPLLMGSIIAANPMDQTVSALDLRGTADVFYSTEGLAYAQQALTNGNVFVKVYYQEMNPDAGHLQIDQ